MGTVQGQAATDVWGELAYITSSPKVYSLSCLSPLTIINIVTNSAAGKVSHTPVMPKAAESANAKMVIVIKPRMIEAVNPVPFQ